MLTKINLKDMANICVIGLGYVGLPLAVEFGKIYSTTGFDINKARIKELENNVDRTLETSEAELKAAKHLSLTSELDSIKASNIYIVTVPTPIDKNKQPILTPLISASKTVGAVLSKGDIVIYESTVYPGATEDDCVPVLEQQSGLKFNKDFFVGYSPERINPGDKLHRLTTITKVTSGSTEVTAEIVNALYGSIVKAGTYKASSIRVAEASKVIENVQRDVNIALINELAIIFDRLGIDTLEVLEAAGTKWNFLPFRPGLVGGHCIGVDPYYLTHKAQEVGYYPEVVLSGRRINDNMGSYVAQRAVKAMIHQSILIRKARILVLGLTFKENCPDLRNTRVVDVVREMQDYDVSIDLYDPWVDAKAAHAEYGKEYEFEMITSIPKAEYDAVIIAVAHTEFKDMGVEKIKSYGKDNAVFFDLKAIFPKSAGLNRL